MPPRYQSTLLSFEEKLRNLADLGGQPGHRGHARIGAGIARGSGLAQSLIQVPEVAGSESSGAAQLLVLSATGDSIASGGDFVTFDSIVAQHGFGGVADPSGGYWVHPITGVYTLTYEHRWASYIGGGLIQLEVDGATRPEGTIADGDSGEHGAGTITYHAEAGTVGRIKVTHTFGSDLTCDAVVRVAITDPTNTGSTASDWTRVMTGDVYDLVWDGTYWWTTEGFSGPAVAKRAGDGTVLATFDASLQLARGITFAGGADLWICGDNSLGAGGDDTERIVSHDQAGTNLSVVVTGTGADGNTGLAWDGSHLWLVEANAGTIERWTTAGAFVDSFSIPADTYRDVAYFNGQLYAVNTVDDVLQAFSGDGTAGATIDISGAVSGATGVFIDADGSLYIAKEGDGAWRYAHRLGGM